MNIIIRNFSSLPYEGYAKVSIPGCPQTYETNEGTLLECYPIKWSYENGIKKDVILSLGVFKTSLLPNQEKTLTLTPTTKPLPPWTLHPNILNFGAQLPLALGMGLKQVFFLPNFKFADAWSNGVLVQDATTFKTFRTHSGFQNTLGASCTFYMTIYADQPFGELTAVFENGTVEQAVSGGLKVADLSLFYKPPFQVEVYAPQVNGVEKVAKQGDYEGWRILKDATVGDGQGVAIKCVWGIGADQDTIQALATNPTGSIVGICDRDTWRSSKALGASGYLPEARASVAECKAVLEPLAKQDPDPWPNQQGVKAQWWLGFINQSPSNTGSQSDFCAGSPLVVQQAIHGETSAPLHQMSLGVYKEANRPSIYWYQNQRMKLGDFPTLCFWSGRVHYDWRWNENKNIDIWRERIAPFDAAIVNYGPADNQHAGNNHLRALYELTGDAFIGDLIKYYISLVGWNYYTGGPGIAGIYVMADSERAHRVVKEGLALIAYFPDAYESKWLAEKVAAKNLEIIAPACTEGRFPPGDDNRVGVCYRCHQGEFPPLTDCRYQVTWQMGFHMEAQSMQYRMGIGKETALGIMTKYMDGLDLVIRDGDQWVDYYLQAKPEISDGLGPSTIANQWCTGVTQLIDIPELASHPKRQKLVNAKTIMYQWIDESSGHALQFWRNNDCWRIND